MNLPNKLTVLRVCLVPVFIAFMLIEAIPYRFLYAFIIFSVASYTDHLDGSIARKRNLITNFGKLMDPLADKILVMSALVCFIPLGFASTVCVLIIMIREFAVTSIRTIAAEQGKVIPANNWGKAKTVSQIAAIEVILVLQTILSFMPDANGLPFYFAVVSEIFIIIATLMSLISGIIYAKDSAHIFKDM